MPTPPERPRDDSLQILLGTYDGETYLTELLDSIVAQTHRGWSLTVRDDGSRDGTLAIAQDYARHHPERIVVTGRQSPSGSAARNFLELVAASTARYVMLADQDDVWLPDKIEVTLAAMRDLEARLGPGVPALVHTDLTVTDADLHVIERSMVRSQALDGEESRLGALVTQNPVTGCTVMVNRALADLVTPPFDDVAMHDWWLAIIAAAFGGLAFVGRPTVLYRQHGSNAVGARSVRTLRYKVARALDRDGVVESLRASYAQAGAFLEHYRSRLAADQVALLDAAASMPRRGRLSRLRSLRRYGLWKNTLIKRVGQVLYG